MFNAFHFHSIFKSTDLPNKTGKVHSGKRSPLAMRQDEMKLSSGTHEHLAAMQELCLENVSYSYTSTLKGSPVAHALNDVSLTFRLGQCVALAGPSGSGKSTVLRLLMRFCRPHSGRIVIRSDIARIGDVDTREHKEYKEQSGSDDRFGLHNRSNVGKNKNKNKGDAVIETEHMMMEYDAQSFTLKDWRREIGYVGQDSILFTATIRYV
jgi:ABC-type multidrug transport system fused ATPase/permease subunit